MPIQIHFGGPVETSRGFVLHSGDYIQAGTMMVNDGIGLTASVDVLRSIAAGDGPRQHLLALGYAGWGPGQLDGEIQANGWLHASADDELIFGDNIDDKWVQAVQHARYRRLHALGRGRAGVTSPRRRSTRSQNLPSMG